MKNQLQSAKQYTKTSLQREFKHPNEARMKTYTQEIEANEKQRVIRNKAKRRNKE